MYYKADHNTLHFSARNFLNAFSAGQSLRCAFPHNSFRVNALFWLAVACQSYPWKIYFSTTFSKESQTKTKVEVSNQNLFTVRMSFVGAPMTDKMPSVRKVCF